MTEPGPGGTVIDRIRATLANRADERAIEYAGEWITWGDVARYGDAIVALLDAAGCPANGRIGIVIRNRAAHAAAVVGLLARHRSLSFVYPFSPPAVLAEQIGGLGAVAIIADAIDWPNLQDAAAAAGCAGIRLGPVGDPPVHAPGLEHMAAAATRQRADDDGSVEVLSSGTTGTPKRIAMPPRILERAVQSAPGQEAGGAMPPQINVWPLGGVGGMCLLAASAAHGVPHVLIERFSVEEFMSAVGRHRPPVIGLPPTAISMIVDAGVPPEDFAGVKLISGGSAHLDPDLQDRFEDRYGIPILWAMGATEFCGTIIRWTPDMRAQVGRTKRGSIGMPMPGVELRVIDAETGEPVAPGGEGLMEVHCPAVRPDWVRTTDIVSIDQDGYVFHRGRHDGAIVRGGFKILPERVVDVLRRHAVVADASVIGMPDARLGEVVVAAVELVHGAGPVSETDLIEFARAHLPATHVPAHLRVVAALPRTPSLKVSLVEVRRLFEAETA